MIYSKEMRLLSLAFGIIIQRTAAKSSATMRALEQQSAIPEMVPKK